VNEANVDDCGAGAHRPEDVACVHNPWL
jgi:hypothetical protein